MIQATLAAADYRAQTEAGMQDQRGVRCTFMRDSEAARVTAQLDSGGCITLTYRASAEADPVCIFVGFMADLAAGTPEVVALTEPDGSLILG